jgi:LysM repeat protein
MGSIRPLFTITVLVVVGAYLYVKINEGPARQHSHSHEGHDHAEDGVPPLVSTSGGATLAQDTSAPAWPAAETNSADATPPLAASPAVPALNNVAPVTPARDEAAADNGQAKSSILEVPPIPELPELPQISDTAPTGAAPAAEPGATPPLELPKNVPMAQYDNNAGPNFGGAPASEVPGGFPALPNFPAESAGTATPITMPPSAPTQNIAPAPAATNPLRDVPSGNTNISPATASPSAADRYGNPLTIPAVPAPTTPTMPAAETGVPSPHMVPAIPAGVQIPDRYGVGAGVTPPEPAVTPLSGGPSAAAGATFAASWPAIQTALEKRDLKQAHQLLSKWHADESLAPAESQKVAMLLGQLAGTVIYSTEHQLEPARVVKPGETLETIAKEYNVPWQLLAKINSVPAADQVRPGQELKVVRGPFSAVVDLQRSEMTLEVDGRYAGTFPVTLPPGGAVAEGQWLVEKKLDSESAVPKFASAPPPAPYRMIILRNANAGATTTATLTIAAESGPQPGQPGEIRVAIQDAEELSDILSVGSRVTVRR